MEYHKTDIGILPIDWKVLRLEDLIKLKNGYAFESEFFSNSGPIVITPGNFKVEGGLNFTASNTVRYSGAYSKDMKFVNGDLLIVMTDLTPDCNLLGKPGIVESEEIILHNQRIGKIIITSKLLTRNFLYWFFASELFSKRMKETATGSTVRHTSVVSINKSFISIPSISEQTAIATALSDTDALISSLEKLIAKKRSIKQGAMQELLKPKKGWEIRSLGELLDKVLGGGTPSRSNKDYWGKEIPWVTVKDFSTFNPFQTQEYITKKGLENSAANLIPKNTLITPTRMGLGKAVIYKVDVSINQDLKALFPSKHLNSMFLYYWFQRNSEMIEKLGSGSTVLGISLSELKGLKVELPSIKDQQNIADTLLDMDSEIAILESKLSKYRQIKSGMMQSLLTGKIRLV